MSSSISPDASRLVARPSWWREAILTLMLQENITQTQLARRMGVDRQRIFRYIRLDLKGTRSSMATRYPEQYLVERMLNDENRERLFRLHAWES